MPHQNFHLSTSDGVKLFAQIWEPREKPWAVICLVHGIGEHSSRYNSWAQKFSQEGVAVLSYDQRGHGYSPGKRGVVASYSCLLDDIDLVLEEAANRFSDVPVVLYGHSLGGGEVLNHVLKRDRTYKGVISTSPWLISQASPGELLVGIARGVSKLTPNLALPTRLDAGLLSHDHEVVEAYKNDDLVHSMVSFRLFTEAYEAGYWALDHARELNFPVLLMHGSHDQITSSEASVNFAFQSSKFCELKIWEGAFHELHNELIKDEVFNFQLEWLKNLLGK